MLKIAILAEKNAPNFGWYVDVPPLLGIILGLGVGGVRSQVVFKMLESAPDAAISSDGKSG